MSKAMQAERKMWSKFYTYDEWMEDAGHSHSPRLLHRGSADIGIGLVGRARVQFRFHPARRPGRHHLGARNGNSAGENSAAAEICASTKSSTSSKAAG